jgi:hypothetical protein
MNIYHLQMMLLYLTGDINFQGNWNNNKKNIVIVYALQSHYCEYI